MRFLCLVGCGLLLVTVEAAYQDLLKASAYDKPEIDNYAFESEIKDILEKIKIKLKEKGLEPLPLARFDFDFYIVESDLQGYVGKMLVHNVSDYIVKNVKFDLLLFKLTVDLLFEVLIIDGEYKLKGNIFETPLDGEGEFLSNTTNLDLSIVAELGSDFDSSEIKELVVTFILDDDVIIFNNSLTGEVNKYLDNAFLQPLIYRVRDEYFPKLLNTLKLVGSDLIHDYDIKDILDFVIGIITGGSGRVMNLFETLMNRN